MVRVGSKKQIFGVIEQVRGRRQRLTAAPLKMVMNSRRLICLPRGSGQGIVSAQTSTLKEADMLQPRWADVRFGSKADMRFRCRGGRFTSAADIEATQTDVCKVPIADIAT